jgi:hypothetical protein
VVELPPWAPRWLILVVAVILALSTVGSAVLIVTFGR